MKTYFYIVANSFLFLLISNLSFAQTDNLKKYVHPVHGLFMTKLVYPQEKREFQLTLAPELRNSLDYNTIQILITIEYGITNY